ncbi:MAG: hypothetical protein EXR72_15555 [Myxococcales bacterium]|nr:hypothetical protein [Myxococcales bacterium]
MIHRIAATGARALLACRTPADELVDCVIEGGIPGGEGARRKVIADCRQAQASNKVDVLFMIDNSNSMEAMQEELRARFPQFLEVFFDLAKKGTFLDLHVGVVTSDYGAGATGAPGCDRSGGGGGGRLVPGRLMGCVAGEQDYIAYNFATGAGNVTEKGFAAAFTCEASVGANGCGFEHPLESVYAALHNETGAPGGFVREGALLVVVFLANEDDCSAPSGSDLFDANRVAEYGYGTSYRCPRFGLVCGGVRPPYGASGGALPMCVSAPNPGGAGPGKLHDVARHIDYFTKPSFRGGVKLSPQDVLLVGVDAPSESVEVLLSNPGTTGGEPYVPCSQLNEASNPPCVPVVQHRAASTRRGRCSSAIRRCA